ncbi:hypothetical protein [Clostridium estertheticum]|uniref:Uncharacterized protein n=1 Tax=Clostridium estertheticum TaxID=238834 RepID=A0A7Y3SYN0_9CLOT|nr:hypothetical protein [Clostridium estertheticum]MBW9153053.1 hypothetical protein [Clostridium estertheticum]MBW9172650.1 hypothetical protein [Clostridium estertheticum]NNU77765.1 hypothetical protein [Clostridium estertheticum]WBL45532.1 hypothetical protein LOR37_12575 [Clostridium estertheticum]WLC73607.1 hypothetical protein KTC99_12455 [Clostridium estertheticum]
MKEMNKTELKKLDGNVSEFKNKLEKFHLDINSENPMQIILKGNLYIEYALRERLKKHLKNPDILDCDKLTFDQLAKSVFSLGLLPVDIFKTVMKVNYIRNLYSINLKYNFNEEEYRKLENTFSPDFKEMYLIFLGTHEYPISTLIKLQTAIFTIWQLILNRYNVLENM